MFRPPLAPPFPPRAEYQHSLAQQRAPTKRSPRICAKSTMPPSDKMSMSLDEIVKASREDKANAGGKAKKEEGGRAGRAAPYSKGGACLCCGKDGHKKADCPMKDKACNLCGKVGHVKAVCRSVPRDGAAPPNKAEKAKKEKAEKACRNCGKAGHIAKDCSEPAKVAPPSKMLYVGNLPFTIEAAAVEAHLSTVASCTVDIKMRRGNKSPAGFAIATFEDVESATKVVEALADSELEGRKLLIRYDNTTAAAEDASMV